MFCHTAFLVNKACGAADYGSVKDYVKEGLAKYAEIETILDGVDFSN